MSSYVILARSESTWAALQAWVSLLGAQQCQEHFERSHDTLEIFDHAAGLITKVLAEGGEATVLVDAVRWTNLDPLGTGWDSALAALILAFPEVQWIFGVPSCAEDEAVPIN